MVQDTTRLISVAELRRLLYSLRDHKVNVCIRFRKLGEMWKSNFMQVVDLNERGAIFNDLSISEFIFVMDLDEVMQFELDGRFQNYEPFNHYEVTPWDTNQTSVQGDSVTLSS
jgi:hypothetical protein